MAQQQNIQCRQGSPGAPTFRSPLRIHLRCFSFMVRGCLVLVVSKVFEDFMAAFMACFLVGRLPAILEGLYRGQSSSSLRLEMASMCSLMRQLAHGPRLFLDGAQWPGAFDGGQGGARLYGLQIKRHQAFLHDLQPSPALETSPIPRLQIWSMAYHAICLPPRLLWPSRLSTSDVDPCVQGL